MKNKNIKEHFDEENLTQKYVGKIGSKEIELTKKEWDLLIKIADRIFCRTGLKLRY